MSDTLVGRYLLERDVSFAVIGAQALLVRGVARFTHDTDFLTLDRTVLAPAFWTELAGAKVEVRRGDLLDPLMGVVRIRFEDDQVDIVVGKFKWQRVAVERADLLDFEGVALPVVQKPDLVLLKLFAGGPQDLWDVHALLAIDDSIKTDVDRLIVDLPDDVQESWRRLRDLQ